MPDSNSKILLHLMVDLDPESYGPQAAAFVALEYQEKAVDDTSPEAEKTRQERGEKAFEEILPKLAELKFAVFETDGNTVKERKFDKLDEISDSSEQERLLTWLRKESPGKSSFWTTNLANSETETAVDADQAGASHRLRSAQAWSAPVPHTVGLTHVLKAQEGRPKANDLLVPYLGNKIPDSDTINDNLKVDGGLWSISACLEIPRDNTDPFNLEVVTHPMQEQMKEHLGGLLTREGYLTPPADGLGFRLVSHLENHSAELFSVERLLSSFELREARLLAALDPLLLWLCRPGTELGRALLKEIAVRATLLQNTLIPELANSEDIPGVLVALRDPRRLREISEQLLRASIVGRDKLELESERKEVLEHVLSSEIPYEAVESAASAIFASQIKKFTPDGAAEAVRSYFSARFGMAQENPPPLATLLPEIAVSDVDLSTQIAKRTEAIEAGLKVIQDRSVFSPDSIPAPLPVQISSNFDAEEIERFAHDFNGLAFAMRRRDDLKSFTDKWAHANLASFRFDGSSERDPDDIPNAIDPVLPVAVDGRGPMYLRYEGFPFSSKAFGGAGSTSGRPFYESEPADYIGAAKDYEPLPNLAYGRAFELFTFAVTNAGSLPKDLVKEDGPNPKPWMPRSSFEGPKEFVGSYPYHRTTAPGAVALAPVNKKQALIGAGIGSVQPLANDYPRIAMMATKSEPAVVDLFQDSTKAGLLCFPSGDGVLEYRIEDLRASEKCQLELRFFSGVAERPEDDGIFRVDSLLADSETTSLSLKFQKVGDKLSVQVGGADPQEIVESQNIWLRLIVSTSEKAVGFSFADPSEVLRKRADGVLLLGSTENIWTTGVQTTAEYYVQPPSVGYLDFERWFSNADLCAAVVGGDESIRDGLKKLRDLLENAYLVRHKCRELAEALSCLPDPSVTQLRFELVESDRLDNGGSEAAVRPHDLREGLSEFLMSEKLERVSEEEWDPKPLLTLVQAFQEALRHKIVIASHEKLNLPEKTGNVYVRNGTVAELLIWPLVDAPHFLETEVPRDDGKKAFHPSVFDPKMTQLAIRKVGKHLAFPPLSMRVEVMTPIPALNDCLVTAALKCECHPKLRNYNVIVDPSSLVAAEQEQKYYDQWRHLAGIEVTTQRWRPTGIPLSKYLGPELVEKHRPRWQAGASKIDVAAFPVEEDQGFENEAFVNRKNDAITTLVRLQPLPPLSLLGAESSDARLGNFIVESFLWEKPSATYFRHSYKLHSRYADALKNSIHKFYDAKKLGDQKVWNLRVAVLADPSRVELTRPQVRALLPLTTSPNSSGRHSSIAPPILALLQEPPYSQAGLAERVVTEIKTGVHWGFKDDVHGEKKLTVIDTRKEVGRDPRLTYQSFDPENAARMHLEAEGPIGLTFDNSVTQSPVFANSAFVLSPQAQVDDLQEHFMAVSARRYLDPKWMVRREEEVTGALDASVCWHITLPPLGELEGDGGKILVVASGDEDVLGWVREEGNDQEITLSVPTELFDPRGDQTATNPIALAKASVDSRLALLHRQTAPGQYSLAILVSGSPRPAGAQPSDQCLTLVEPKPSQIPQLLASFEWSKPGKLSLSPMVGTIAVPTMASLATSVTWTRTGRDFDRWCVTKNKEEMVWKTFGSEIQSRLVSSKKNGKDVYELTFVCPEGKRCRLHGSSEKYSIFPRIPLHVHRHLGVFTTTLTNSPGRPMETFLEMALYESEAAEMPKTGNTRGPIYSRLFELETPAAILCNPTPSVPTTYQSAYFDLKSRGLTEAKTLKLFLRFVTNLTNELTIKLEQPIDIGGEAINITIKEDLSDLAWVVITLSSIDIDKDIETLEMSKFYHLGTSKRPPPLKPDKTTRLKALLDNGFVLKIESKDSEVWCDASLLGSQLTNPGFDFEWLFPKEQKGDSDNTFPVAPEHLKNLVEAQARIIAVSPPVEVRKD